MRKALAAVEGTTMRSLRPFHTHPTHQSTELFSEVSDDGQRWRRKVYVWQWMKWELVRVRVKGSEGV